MKKFFHLIVLMAFFFETNGQHQLLQGQQLDSFISRAMNDWHVMGVSVAVVKKNEVIFSKGYGYRDHENKKPVTENTIFPIASCSKPFVSALMGMAADEKRLELNKPVHNYLPEFNLYSDDLTQKATVKNLLNHSTGLPGHDWAWTFNTNYPSEIYLQRIKNLKPSYALGTKYQYSNFSFFVLGTLAEKIYNKKWVELLNEKLFHPLGMKNSAGNYTSLKDHENLSRTYDYRDSFTLQETKQMDDLLGAGSILSTSGDLARWLQLWISGGMYKDNRILSAQYVKQAITPGIIVTDEIDAESIDEPITTIGLSWFLSSYRGHYKAHHNGNLAGYSSSVTFFPFDSIGIVVLANQNGSPLIRLIPDFIADIIFNLDVHDKNTGWLAKRKKYESMRKNPPAINLDTVTQKPQLPFSSYCGEFHNPGYGTVKITPYQNGLLLTYENLKLVLISKGVGHTFSSHHIEDNLIYQQRGEGDVVFKTNKNGHVESFSVPFEPAVDDIVFSTKNKSVASKKN
ncbi:MAG TPA: serine hydrolase [Chitinophagaceae bacterium]|nr:serine hydrolase [Chitinophagaceae bacterium]